MRVLVQVTDAMAGEELQEFARAIIEQGVAHAIADEAARQPAIDPTGEAQEFVHAVIEEGIVHATADEAAFEVVALAVELAVADEAAAQPAELPPTIAQV